MYLCKSLHCCIVYFNLIPILQLEATFNKISDISIGIAASLRDDYCHCTINAGYISEGELSCPDKLSDVIFRAAITGTPDASSGQLIGFLKQLVSGRAGIVVQGIRLYFDPNCTVEIESFADPLCATEAINSPSVGTAGGQGGNDISIATIFGATVGVLIVIIAVACAFFVFCRVIKKPKSTYPRLVKH